VDERYVTKRATRGRSFNVYCNFDLRRKVGTGHELLSYGKDAGAASYRRCSGCRYFLPSFENIDNLLRNAPSISHPTPTDLIAVPRQSKRATSGSLFLFYFNFERLRQAGTGHESLTIIYRSARILVSARDPGSRFVALGMGFSHPLCLAVPHFCASKLI
jgi:hypothetical protein